MLWYSLEVPHGGTSNEYDNICFRREIRKILAGKKHLIWSCSILSCICLQISVLSGDLGVRVTSCLIKGTCRGVKVHCERGCFSHQCAK